MKTRIVIGALATFMLASLVHAAIQLQPGEWRTTQTGTENGKPAKPEVETDCMSAEEARDAVNVVNEMKKQMTDQGAQCQKLDVKQSGETVTFTMKCGVPQQFLFDITGVYTFVSATRYTGRMKSEVVLMGQKTTTDKTIEAVWVGECRPGAAKKKRS